MIKFLIKKYWNNSPNIKFIIGLLIFVVFGELCNQLVCVAPFITSMLSVCNAIETVCLVRLCLNENFPFAPKIMALSFFQAMVHNKLSS